MNIGSSSMHQVSLCHSRLLRACLFLFASASITTHSKNSFAEAPATHPSELRNIHATVTGSTGQPVLGANVFIFEDFRQDFYVDAVNGEFSVNAPSISGYKLFSDEKYLTKQTSADGEVAFDQIAEVNTTIVLDKSGYALLTGDALAPNSVQIHLNPWSKVQGKLFKNGHAAEAGQEIVLECPWLTKDTGTKLLFRSVVTTDATGSFTFDRVPQGEGRVFHQISGQSDDEANPEFFTTGLGSTIKVELGSNGGSIAGKVRIDSLHDHPAIAGELRPILPEELVQVRWGDEPWWTPAAIKRWRTATRYLFTVREDGTFEVENVRAGKYLVRLTATVRGTEGARQPQEIAGFAKRIEMTEGDGHKKLDLGELSLFKRHLLKIAARG